MLTAGLVFEEYTGALLRGVRCPEGLRMTVAPPKPHELSAKAEIAWEATLPIDPLATYVYDGCADNSFPIHTSPRFARSVGLPGIIVHGTETLTFAVREIVNREGVCGPGPAAFSPVCIHRHGAAWHRCTTADSGAARRSGRGRLCTSKSSMRTERRQ